jgi:arsenite transporter
LLPQFSKYFSARRRSSVAAAIALFGFQSGAALATVVGVLVEVPVMLSVVRIVLRTRNWYEHRAV